MNETLKTLFGLSGGLALFLYGMNRMSDGLQKVAGDRMKRILGLLTRNPLMVHPVTFVVRDEERDLRKAARGGGAACGV